MKSVDVDTVDKQAFAIADRWQGGTSAWHTHRFGQLIYAASGALLLEFGTEQWLLPPERAAFICAKVEHRVICKGSVELQTIYLSPVLTPHQGPPCQVFTVSPMAKEMFEYAMQWGPNDTSPTPLAATFFSLIGLLLPSWATAAVPLCLPIPSSQELRVACDFTLANLDSATMESAAKAAGVSARTLSRRFQEETGQPWRQFLSKAKIIEAMQLLVHADTNVTDVAHRLGFEDSSSFSRAFRRLLGESPSDFVKRSHALGD